MAGQYPSMWRGAGTLLCAEGPRGFYRGWTPAMSSKIPAYALTWTFFQSFKRLYLRTGQVGGEAPAAPATDAAAEAAAATVQLHGQRGPRAPPPLRPIARFRCPF